MVCRICQLFEGNESGLCAGCRALRRIREVQCGGLLVLGQQSRAVSALRECAGALTDLAEEAVRIKKKEGEEAPAPDQGHQGKAAVDSGSGNTPEATGGASSGSGKLAEAPKESKVKADLGDDGSEEAPGVLAIAAVEDEKVGEGGRGESPQEEVKKKKRRKRKLRSPARNGQPGLLRAGLRPAPKPAVARHFAHLPTPPPAPRRPRSPDHPPPSRGSGRGESARRGKGRGRSRSPHQGQRRRGSKGAKRRERGRLWPYHAPY